MTQEEKQLLLVDLCARLPYYTELYSNISDGNWAILTPVVISNLMSATDKLVIKPYLRPLSSMTEEEEMEYNEILTPLGDFMFEQEELFKPIQLYKSVPFELYEFFNAHHFDFRGLIEKGLAIEVTEENNPYKE